MISISIILIIIFCTIILPYQIGTAKEIIGTQRHIDIDNLQGIIIKCLGDALLPETVCTNIGSYKGISSSVWVMQYFQRTCVLARIRVRLL